MIDRAINLLVIGVLLVAMASLTLGVYRAWHATSAWSKEWELKRDGDPPHSAEEILSAMRKADAAGATDDVKVFREYLGKYFRPTGRVSARITYRELLECFLFFVIPMSLLLIPVSLNYVRHGKFRVWNRST